MRISPARFRAADMPKAVLSWPFALAAAVVVAMAGAWWAVGRLWPDRDVLDGTVAGVAMVSARLVAAGALNGAAADKASTPDAARAPVHVETPGEPVPVVVARGVRARVNAWLVVTAGALLWGVADPNTWKYTGAVVVHGLVAAVPVMIAWLVRRALRERGDRLRDAVPLPVRVVGFTDPIARGLMLQPVDGGRRLVVTSAWRWRLDVAVGDVLTWVGPWPAGSVTPGEWQTPVPVWVLYLRHRGYLVTGVGDVDAAPER